jgi:hypothetical protein
MLINKVPHVHTFGRPLHKYQIAIVLLDEVKYFYAALAFGHAIHQVNFQGQLLVVMVFGVGFLAALGLSYLIFFL